MKKLCIIKKRNINSGIYDNIITSKVSFVKENCGSSCCRNHPQPLLLTERLAVGALVSSGVDLVGTHQDLFQRTVVLVAAVMGTLLDGALDALVCMTVHKKPPLKWDSGIVWMAF